MPRLMVRRTARFTVRLPTIATVRFGAPFAVAFLRQAPGLGVPCLTGRLSVISLVCRRLGGPLLIFGAFGPFAPPDLDRERERFLPSLSEPPLGPGPSQWADRRFMVLWIDEPNDLEELR